MTSMGHTSTKQDIVRYILKQGQATAQELAEALDISPQATRRHLKELDVEGIVEHKSMQTGLGRPQHIYQLSRLGRESLPHRYREFAVSLLDTLAETAGEERVREVLHKQWQHKAEQYREQVGPGTLRERLIKLVQLRQMEGFMAEYHSLEGDRERFVLVEHNCAISSVAESYPSVCGHELEMFAAVLPDCKVERTQWLNDGEHQCGYSIELDDAKSGQVKAGCGDRA